MAVMSRFLAAVPALPVSDERRAVEFFEKALGFEEVRHDGKGLGILRRDAVEVHVWPADGSAPGAERHLAGSASCRIEVTGVDELYQHCQRLDIVHPNAPLRDQWWGVREFGVLDPDNNLISLYQRLPLRPLRRELGQQGRQRSNVGARVWTRTATTTGMPATLRFRELRHCYATWLVSLLGR